MPHTPGPYHLVTLDAPLSDWTGARYVIRSKKHAPGGVAVIIGGTGAEEELATARLFQASPTMLTALKAVGDNLIRIGMPREHWSTELIGLVDAAIDEAEGRQ
jgi:hypothetical protein